MEVFDPSPQVRRGPGWGKGVPARPPFSGFAMVARLARSRPAVPRGEEGAGGPPVTRASPSPPRHGPRSAGTGPGGLRTGVGGVL